MAEYYLANSLKQLRAEINQKWPERSKASDGWIGDTAHQARKSDHNPDWDSNGVVRAIDITVAGIDVQALLRAVMREPRVAYVIYNHRIASATDDGTPWDWEPYSGTTNPHVKHVHVSIKHTRQAETDMSRWFDSNTSGGSKDDTTISGLAIHHAVAGKSFNIGDAALFDVRQFMAFARAYGAITVAYENRWLKQQSERDWTELGAVTKEAVKAVQGKANLVKDGVFGNKTADVLRARGWTITGL